MAVNQIFLDEILFYSLSVRVVESRNKFPVKKIIDFQISQKYHHCIEMIKQIVYDKVCLLMSIVFAYFQQSCNPHLKPQRGEATGASLFQEYQ
jgi:hypothetical protein